jgi:hypothetical protein
MKVCVEVDHCDFCPHSTDAGLAGNWGQTFCDLADRTIALDFGESFPTWCPFLEENKDD